MQTITKADYQRRIKSYTRKLAEIESFIETSIGFQSELPDPQIIIHKYWQND